MKENKLLEAMSLVRLNFLRFNNFNIQVNNYRKVARDACRVGSLAIISTINKLLIDKTATSEDLVKLALVVY